MTENEKLRALLEEARNLYGCHGACTADCVWTRIDAALAEPVADDCGWHEYLRGDAAEGDARLLLDGAGRASRTGDDDLANAALYGAAAIRLVPRLSTERDEARAEVAAAYRRGAEAMREAAAGKAYTTLSLHDEPCRRSELRQAVVHAIEALPIPEDKR